MKIIKVSRSAALPAVALLLFGPCLASGQGLYGSESMRGAFTLSGGGEFSSAPPPFSGDLIEFDGTITGLFHFDGAGQVYGEFVLTFQNPTGPYFVVSPTIVTGTYDVEPSGRLVITTEEYFPQAPPQNGGMKRNEAVYECRIVRRNQLARCIMSSLKSFAQDPQGRVLPVAFNLALEQQT